MADFSNDTVPCQFCGQSIQARSVRCLHCMKEMPSSLVSGQSVPQRMSLIAIKLDPHNVDAYEARASAYASFGQGESAALDSAKSENIQLKLK